MHKCRAVDAQNAVHSSRARHRQMTGRVCGLEVTCDKRVAKYSFMHKNSNPAAKKTAKTPSGRYRPRAWDACVRTA